MGAGELIAVADAGPLIHLAEIGALELLSVFETVQIPDAVWQETVGRGRVTAAELAELGNVRRCTVSTAEIATYLTEDVHGRLHPGERDCLVYCRRQHVELLLTDDLSVREAAKKMGLKPVGSLGVVVRAYRAGRVSFGEAEGYLYQLFEQSTLFVTRTIVDLALEELRRLRPALPP